MSRPFWSDEKRPKSVVLLLLSLLRHTLFPRDFSGTIADTDS